MEGDSAGGSAKQARSQEFQAVLPLRGKILNTWEVEPAQVLGSQEVHDITLAIGVDQVQQTSAACAMARFAFSLTLTPMARTLRRCCVPCSCATSSR